MSRRFVLFTIQSIFLDAKGPILITPCIYNVFVCTRIVPTDEARKIAWLTWPMFDHAEDCVMLIRVTLFLVSLSWLRRPPPLPAINNLLFFALVNAYKLRSKVPLFFQWMKFCLWTFLKAFMISRHMCMSQMNARSRVEYNYDLILLDLCL